MTVPFQVIILALLITCVVGIVIGYIMAQKRFQQEAEVRQQQNQDQLQAIQSAHDQRLQDALFRARQDYEAQLTRQIGHYQDQFAQNLAEREQEHQTRVEVWQEGLAAAGASPSDDMTGGTAVTQPEVLQLKHQYEARLKEAAHKLQQAYEQQLAQRFKATKADLQQNYETQLAQKIEHYEAQLAARVTQLETEFEARQASLAEAEAAPVDDASASISEPPEFPQASPSEIMGTGNNEPTITLHRPFAALSSDPGRNPAANLFEQDLFEQGKGADQGQVPTVPDADPVPEQPLVQSAEQDPLLADLAELEEIPELSESLSSDDPLDPLEALDERSESEAPIEIEQLGSLDLDDISQLS
jgi:uncharacterized protein YneF (UPF0154 family)